MAGIVIPSWMGEFVAPLSVVLILILGAAVLKWHFNHRPVGSPNNALLRQGLFFLLFFIGVLGFIVSLPIQDSTRGQLLNLIGLVISATIALSSTTFIGNMMAGLLMRALRNFRIGDFIRSEGYFGRVSDMGLLHTEIQTEDRDLVTLPNLFIATHPLRVVRSSGTVVSTDLSLGYDVAHIEAERILLQAAASAGLEEPFVQILSLDDYSVSYRVAGILAEVKQMLTSRSRLRACVLDALHGAGIEICSPLYQTQRQIPGERVIIPKEHHAALIDGEEIFPEDSIFDKAEQAESLEKLKAARDSLDARIEEMETRLREGEEPAEALEKRLERAKSLKTRLDRRIEEKKPD